MNNNKTKTKSLATVAVSAAALYSVSAVVNAGLISNDNGFSVSGNQSVTWDVDGNGIIDFSFSANQRFVSATSFGASSGALAKITGFARSVAGNSFTSTSGFGNQVTRKRSNKFFQVAKTTSNTLTENGSLNNNINLVSSNTLPASSFGNGSDIFTSFVDGDGILGFKVFTPGDESNFFLGWANISITSLGNFSPLLTINSWCYSDNNADVHIESCEAPVDDPAKVPEPSTSALLALGLGAAGIRRWKAQRKARAAA